MKNVIKSILFLVAFLSGNNLLAQNVSTGIDGSGNSIGVTNPDPFWVITAGPITGTSYMVSPYFGYWEPTPVAGTNAGWINSNGTHWTTPGAYTLVREFEVGEDECSFVTNFSVAYDDELFLLELVPPTGAPINLGIPPAPGYQLSAPVVVAVTSPMPGTWKIRAINNLIDGIGAFILSGSILHFSTPGCIPVPCDCTTLVNDFGGNVNGCQGDFNGAADVPSCMQLVESTWSVNGIYQASGTAFSYSFPGNGNYTVCFTTKAVTADGTICETTTCHEFKVDGCCTCESISPNFQFHIDRCRGLFEAPNISADCFNNVSYDWYVNNVFVGSGQGFMYDFPGNGVYVVCLRISATLPDGTICRKERCIDMVVQDCDKKCECDNIQLDFNIKTDKCNGYFTGGAIIPNCMTNVQYEWKVDGLPAGTGPVLNHVFTGNGTHVVCMIVHTTLPDGKPCDREICKDVEIVDCGDCDCTKLMPDFNFNVEDCIGYFNGFVNGPACGKNATYNWTVDGSPAGSGQTFSYPFPGNGTYTVCLDIVVMINGAVCTQQICKEVVVENCDTGCNCDDLIPDFSIQTDKCFGHFVSSIHIPECMTSVVEEWYVNGVLTATGAVFNHVFPGSGPYTICLKVSATMPNGVICTQEICKNINIIHCAGCACDQVQVSYDYNVENCIGHFNATVFSPACLGTLNYDWYVDGILVGSGMNYDHVFPGNGTYVVCFEAWVVLADGTICSKKVCKEVVITDCSGCSCDDLIPSFTIQTDKCFGHFVANVHIPTCMTNIVQEWYVNGVLTATGAVFNYNFPGSATYNVCLKVTATMPDGTICTQEICKRVTIVHCNPQPCDCNSVQVDYTYQVNGCSVSLHGTANYPACMTSVSYNWYVDNVYAGSGQNYVHTFTGNGTHVICLRVTTILPSGAKCLKEKCYTVVINNCNTQPCSCNALQPSFLMEIGQCFGQFTSNSNIPSCMTNIQYFWKVGTVYAGATPSITYTFPGSGTYNVCVMVTGTLPSGQLCERWFCQLVTVNCFGTPPTGTGMQQTDDNSIQDADVVLYPNPASSEINVEFDLEKAQDVSITLKTMDGKRILSETRATEAGRQHFNIQVPSSTADGMIIVEIVTGERTIIRKVNVSKH